MSKKVEENAVIKESSTDEKKCSKCGESEVYSKDMCLKCYKAHWYQQKKASAPPNPDKKRTGRPTLNGENPTACISCGEKRIYARGLCYKCYKRAHQAGKITKDGVDASYQKPRTTDPKTGEKKICSYCGLNPVYANNLCRKCNTRAKRHGGDPAYKSSAYLRTLKSKHLLKERSELIKEKEKKNE